MTDITLRVICDRAAAASFGLIFGAGWARVLVTVPPPADWHATVSPFLRTAKVVLDSLGVIPALPPRPRVFIEGPDAPTDTADSYGIVFRAWVVVLRGETAQTGDPPVPGPQPPAHAAGQAPLFGALPTAQPQPQPQSQPQPPPQQPAANTPPPGLPAQSGRGGSGVRLQAAAAAADADRRAAPNERLVVKMVETVKTYIKEYGAAPDFHSTKPSAREKAYNYIRSTSANQGASDAVVEEVRRRLAA